MCFSATSSFVAAGLLTALGALALRSAKTPRHLMLASIPMMFALQQAAEGIVWLTMNNAQYADIHQWAGLIFLGFALVVWPVWIPFSLWNVEQNIVRKNLLIIVGLVGSLISAYSLFIMATTQLRISIACNSISYAFFQGTLMLEQAYLNLYGVPTIIPFFISSIPFAWTFGIALSIALFVSWIFKAAALGSVWCFFAAILSLLILTILR